MHHHLGGPKQTVARCPVTNRPYEDGCGALSRQEQSSIFVREAEWSADMPQEGEVCPQTGRKFEIGSGALPKTLQTANFLKDSE